MLFADVVGSTRLYEVHGDHKARDLVLLCVDLMRHSTERNRGTVIKTIGDEIMAIFPTADDAANAAAEMQHDVGAHPELALQGQHIAIRIGCHFGPVVFENKDVFGSSVHTANRMTSQAKAGQIIVTAETVQRLSREWRSCTRRIDITSLRGRSDAIELYEVLWQQEDATSMLPSIALETGAAARVSRLRLSFGGKEYVLDAGARGLTLGRAEESDIVVTGNLVSRLHARIEIMRNRFVLIDQSTNGTFVTNGEAGGESFVRRDSLTLRGSGLIGFGRLPERGAADAVEFQLEE